MNIKTHMVLVAFLSIVGAGCATTDPEAFQTREGTYPGAKPIGRADRPPGTCEYLTQSGTTITLPCRNLVSDDGGTVGSGVKTTGDNIPAADCYMHLGDGTNRPVPCQYAGDAWLKLKDQAKPERP